MDQLAIIERLKQAGIAFGRLNDVAGLSQHPQLRRMQVNTPSGQASVAAGAAIRSNASTESKTVPAIGAHSDSIRNEFT